MLILYLTHNVIKLKLVLFIRTNTAWFLIHFCSLSWSITRFSVICSQIHTNLSKRTLVVARQLPCANEVFSKTCRNTINLCTYLSNVIFSEGWVAGGTKQIFTDMVLKYEQMNKCSVIKVLCSFFFFLFPSQSYLVNFNSVVHLKEVNNSTTWIKLN